MLPAGMDWMMSLPKAIAYLSPGGNVQNTPSASSVAENQLPSRLLSFWTLFDIRSKRLVASCQSPLPAALKNASKSEGSLFPSCFANARAWVSCAARNCFNCAEAPELSSDHDDAGCFLPQPAIKIPAAKMISPKDLIVRFMGHPFSFKVDTALNQ